MHLKLRTATRGAFHVMDFVGAICQRFANEKLGWGFEFPYLTRRIEFQLLLVDQRDLYICKQSLDDLGK